MEILTYMSHSFASARAFELEQSLLTNTRTTGENSMSCSTL
jgi:hypothetical protein